MPLWTDREDYLASQCQPDEKRWNAGDKVPAFLKRCCATFTFDRDSEGEIGILWAFKNHKACKDFARKVISGAKPHARAPETWWSPSRSSSLQAGQSFNPSMRRLSWGERSGRWAHCSLSVSPHPPHKRLREDKPMNASRVLGSCSDKHQEGPADTREAGCQQQLPDLSTHPDSYKSSPRLLKDLFSWGWFVHTRPLPVQYVIFTSRVYFWTCQHTAEKVRHMRACTVVVHSEAQAQLHSWKSWFEEFSQESLTQQLGWQTHVGEPPSSPFCYHSHFISVLCMKIWRLLLSIGFAGFIWKLAISLRHDNTGRVLAELYLSMYFIKEKLKWFWAVEVFSFLFFLFLTADSLALLFTRCHPDKSVIIKRGDPGSVYRQQYFG